MTLRDEHGRGDRWRWPWITLIVLFMVLVWPMILSPQSRTGDVDDEAIFPISQMGDQIRYHEQVILTFVQEWPRVNLVNYDSATTPGYHLCLAVVARYVSDSRLVLQLFSSLFTLGLLLVVFRYAVRGAGDRAALVLILPLLSSIYTVTGGIWLMTDNAALLLVCVALGGAVFAPVTHRRVVLGALAATGAVLVRQVHVWIIAPVALVAILASPIGRSAPRLLQDGENGTWGVRSLVAVAPVLLLPVIVVAVFAGLWGGLTPVGFVKLHGEGWNPVSYSYALAITGAMGVFYLPALAAEWRTLLRPDWKIIAIVSAAVLLALALPSTFDKDAGRMGGAVWTLVQRIDVSIAGRSLLLAGLAGVGAAVLVHAFRRCARAGRMRGATILLLAMLGWVLAQSMNPQLWQRYYELPILIMLIWLVALGRPDGDVETGEYPPAVSFWRWPVIALCLVQLALTVTKVYLPVLNWHPAN